MVKKRAQILCYLSIAYKGVLHDGTPLQVSTTSMSLTTVSRLLAKFSLSFYVAKIKPKLTEKHKLESLNFARMNLKQPIEYWRTFQYTDEYRSKCYANRASRVLRTPKDEWNPKYFLEVQNMDCFRA
ncbi:Transposase_Tc1-like protein [Hexamita inflata]|uniref:Transposase Tc1-like protein n=1 Tax=Hexamita inflata TaxID=28002 RepID=A0AA86PCX6_9EUKA|nr:Transposase Tc1-like protein [Hexamita inflata]